MEIRNKVSEQEYHVKLTDDDDLPLKEKVSKGKPIPAEEQKRNSKEDTPVEPE